MPATVDLHLSAYRIATDTIKRIESLGFTRDAFANNTRCATTAYHGTFRGARVLPDDNLWRQLEDVLGADSSFIGGLEEESFDAADVVFLAGDNSMAPPRARPMTIAQPPAGRYKACDIHVNIDLGRTTPSALDHVDALQLASFDKPEGDGIHRIFTATCERLDSGRVLFQVLSQYLQDVPGLFGKVKFERISRFFRHPADAPVLPMTDDHHTKAWIATATAPP